MESVEGDKKRARVLERRSKSIHDPAMGWMRAGLDPCIRCFMCRRHQAVAALRAGGVEEIWTNVALLELGDEDAVDVVG